MDEPTVVVGLVTRALGLRGEVVVQNRSDNPERWTPGSVVFIDDGRALTIRSSREHGGRLTVAFSEVADRTAAEALRGALLVVPETWLPELGEDEWWPHELEGCRVITRSGRDLGEVREVIANPANDLWVAVDDAGNETLVPALKDLLIEVDVAAKRIEVRDVPGLTAPEDPDDDAEPRSKEPSG
jgi:16S rRNA processing protein RimM